MPVKLTRDEVAALTEALLDADPAAEADIARAVAHGVGLSAVRIEQGWWPNVDVLWISVGSGPAAYVRYVCVAADGLWPISAEPAVFDMLARAGPGLPGDMDPEQILGYAAFFLEITRPMDRTMSLLPVEAVDGDHADRLLARLFGPSSTLSPAARLEVLGRHRQWRRREPDAGFAAVEALLESVGRDPAVTPDDWVYRRLLQGGFRAPDIRALERLRRHPTPALTSTEAGCLEAARRVLGGAYERRGVTRLSDAQGSRVVAGDDLWAPFTDERLAGVIRHPLTGDTLRMAGGPGLALSVPLDRLESAEVDVDRSCPGWPSVSTGSGAARPPAGANYLPANGRPLSVDSEAQLYSVDGGGEVVARWQWRPGSRSWERLEGREVAWRRADSPEPAERLGRLLSVGAGQPRVSGGPSEWEVAALLRADQEVWLVDLRLLADGSVVQAWERAI